AKDREQRYQVVKDTLLDLKKLRERLSFEAEFERSVQPSSATDKESHGFSGVKETATVSVEKPITDIHVSGQRVLLSVVKRPATAVAITLLIVVLAASFILFFSRRSPALTDKDIVLIADFVNTTGDPVFDGTLNDALA